MNKIDARDLPEGFVNKKPSLEDGISKVYQWFLNIDSYSPKV